MNWQIVIKTKLKPFMVMGWLKIKLHWKPGRILMEAYVPGVSKHACQAGFHLKSSWFPPLMGSWEPGILGSQYFNSLTAQTPRVLCTGAGHLADCLRVGAPCTDEQKMFHGKFWVFILDCNKTRLGNLNSTKWKDPSLPSSTCTPSGQGTVNLAQILQLSYSKTFIF